MKNKAGESNIEKLIKFFNEQAAPEEDTEEEEEEGEEEEGEDQEEEEDGEEEEITNKQKMPKLMDGAHLFIPMRGNKK